MESYFLFLFLSSLLFVSLSLSLSLSLSVFCFFFCFFLLVRSSLEFEEHPVAAEGPSGVAHFFREELDVVQVSGVAVRAGIEREVPPAVLAHVHRVGTSDGPNLVLAPPRDVRKAVSAGLDVRLDEVVRIQGQVRFLLAHEELPPVQGHPQSLGDITLDESH